MDKRLKRHKSTFFVEPTINIPLNPAKKLRTRANALEGDLLVMLVGAVVPFLLRQDDGG